MSGAVWCLLAVVLAGGGSAARDRWPASRLARLAALGGGAWFFGVVLGLFLLS